MNLVHGNVLKKAVISLLAVGIFGFYATSILTMQHSETMEMTGHGIVSVEHCAKSLPTQDCVSYHLSILHNISEIGHNNAAIQFSFAFLLTLVVILFLGVTNKVRELHGKLRTRYRRLTEKTIQAFFTQLGHFLVLFEKRDPSYAFTLA